jgi:hypothetical protein
MSSRTYIRRKPQFYFDVDAELVSDESFTPEGPNHPRIVFRAPTWGDVEEASSMSDGRDDGFGDGHLLLVMCLEEARGDFSLCLHRSTRGIGDWPDEVEDRLPLLKRLAAPDMTRLAEFVSELASPTEDEAGESVAPAG